MALNELLNIPAVQNFLFDGKVLADFRKVAEKHGLPSERAKEFLDLINAILDDKLPLVEVPALIAQAFGKTEDEAKMIAIEIVGFQILPLDKFFPGVKEQLIAWGGKESEFPQIKVGKEKISAFAWATRLTESAALGFSDVLVKRLALLLDGRIKGEKTAETLKTFFGRPLSIGGLALPKEKIDALLKEIETEAPYIEIVSDEEYREGGVSNPAVDAIPGEITQTIEIATSHELAAEVPVHAVASTTATNDEDREIQAMDQKFAELTKSQPTESIKPIMPGSRVSAARSTTIPSAKKIVPLKPKPAKTELTVGSVSPKDPDRKMTDIVSASRLMGPVDQLGSMSAVEFRRLSSDPSEAARKVEDLLAALVTTGYEEKVKGISAWRKSPINQLYLAISEEALTSGTTLPDVCSRWRKAGKDCLSPAEIKAVMALNMKLRF